MDGKRPSIKVFVAYQTRDGSWKGFCAPYDVTCYAETFEDAKQRTEDLVALYEKNLEKHDYPPHLTFKELSDEEDQKIFEKVWSRVLEERRSFLEYQLRAQEEEEYSISGQIRSFVREKVPA